MNQPAAELLQLNVFLGDWETEGLIHPGPWGPGGKFSWTEHSEWMTGNFFLVGHWHFHMPADMGGPGEEIFIIGYDSHRRVYTFDAFSSHGLHQVSTGRVKGGIWIWDSDALQDGKRIRQRMMIEFLSPTSYTLKFEHSSDGRKWQLFMEGQAAKKQ
ncbi:MAG TPA: DUF1579 family protein [Verrucomicrobiae bacterium]|jgi:hypothetical protein|nr:DUF1579 family protein [Verrucomicrobiae bacterium]